MAAHLQIILLKKIILQWKVTDDSTRKLYIRHLDLMTTMFSKIPLITYTCLVETAKY